MDGEREVVHEGGVGILACSSAAISFVKAVPSSVTRAEMTTACGWSGTAMPMVSEVPIAVRKAT